MDNNKRLKLITIAATDFEGFKDKFETLTLAEQTEFQHYIDMIKDYLRKKEKSRTEKVTGFPAP